VTATALIRSLCPAIAIGAGLLLSSCDRTDPAASEPAPPGGGEAAPAPEEPTATAVPPSELTIGAPQITFAKARHDFGSVTDAGTYTARFEFRNTGTDELIIRDIKSACGCTVPKLDKWRFASGEGSSIDVVFDPTNRKGGFIKYLFVASNSARNSFAKLSVTADISPLVRFDSFFLGVGAMELGKEHRRSFSGYFIDPETEITQIVSENPHVSVEVLRTSRVPRPTEGGAEEYRSVMVITFAPTAPWGIVDPGKLTLTARQPPGPGEDEPREAEYTLYISAELYSDLRPEPSALSIEPALKIGDSFDAAVVLRSISGNYFAVIDASHTEPADRELEVRVEPLDPTSYRISIHGTATAPGALSGKITVRTDVPGEENLTLQYGGYVK
jgi:hypothetical protein